MICRWSSSAVLPIEVWDLEVDGQPLQAWRRSPQFFSKVAAMVSNTIHSPPKHWTNPSREAMREVRQVHLTGGAVSEGIRTDFRDFPTRVAVDPMFHAVMAKSTALPSSDRTVDVGQTGIKIFDGSRARREERDLARAPYRERTQHLARARETTLNYLRDMLEGALRPLLALPCEISEKAELGGSSYCWDERDRHFANELAARSGVNDLFLLNDAELAAFAIPEPDVVTLVLTVGHGVGGALRLPS